MFLPSFIRKRAPPPLIAAAPAHRARQLSSMYSDAARDGECDIVVVGGGVAGNHAVRDAAVCDDDTNTTDRDCSL